MAEDYNKRQHKTAGAPSKHNLNTVNASGRLFRIEKYFSEVSSVMREEGRRRRQN